MGRRTLRIAWLLPIAVAVLVALALLLGLEVHTGGEETRAQTMLLEALRKLREHLLLVVGTAAAVALLVWLFVLGVIRRTKVALAEINQFALQLDGSGRQFPADARTAELHGLVVALNQASLRLAEQHRVAQLTERELRALTGNIPGVVYRCLADHRLTMEHLSQEFERLTGYAAVDLVGNRVRSYVDIIHPSDLAKVRTLLDSAIEQRRPYAAEYRLRAADGSTRWVLDKGQAVFNEHGDLLHLTGVIINDTARHSAITALARSEARHRRLVENLAEVVWQSDAKARVSFVNRAWQQVSGLPPEALVGHRLFDRIAEADQPAAIGAWQRLVAGREDVVHWEARIATTSGELRWGEFTARLTLDADGQPNGVAGLLSDIHDRKLLDARLREGKEQLRESLELSRQLLEAMPHPVYYMDRQGRFRGVNRAWEAFHGRGRDAVIGLTSRDLGPPALADLIEGKDRELLVGEAGHQSFEVVLNNAAGEPRTMLFSKAVLTSSERERTGLIGVLTDITDSSTREEALRVSEAKARQLAQVVDQASEAIMVTDLDDRLLAWNRGAERLYGFTEAEVRGRSAYEVLRDAETGSGEAQAERVRAGRDEWRSVTRRLRKDGTTVDVELSLSPLFDPEGRHIGQIGVARDISDRLRYEAALEAAKDAAEAANQAKGAFLANMSHEIRTPMNGIIGMTELALDTDLDDEQRDYLSSVRRSAENLLQVINDVLDYSKIEARRIQLEQIGFSLRAVLSDSVKSLAPKARERSLQVVLDVAPGVPDALVGDPLRIGQVLLNLVGNAIKFTERGEVVVSVEPAASVGADGRMPVRFRVRDTGVGIDPQKQREIFEAFTQADSSTTRRFGGTGLGLSISRELVSLMGGELAVESSPGQGSTFWFDLAFPIAERGCGEPVGLRPLRALLVDPSGSSRQALVHLFSHWGLHCTDCASLDEARQRVPGQAAVEASFDLVVVHGEAEALCTQRLRDWIGDRVPLMVVAGARSPRATDPAWTAVGATAVLIQPVTSSDLFDTLGRCMALPDDAAVPPAPPPPAFQPATRALDVLLAEDNPVNQKLARTLLERSGHRVCVASDGLEAVEAWRNGRFDVVLMDLQMPRLGGFEATARIRAIEAEHAAGPYEQPVPRTPIVALTAHAMIGDEERCLAAGMDAYLSKPLRRERLAAVLEQMTPARDGTDPVGRGRGTRPAASAPVVDTAALLDTVGGDPAMLSHLCALFLESLPAMLERLRSAVEDGRADEVAAAAHALRGVISNFHARPSVEALSTLERAAAEGRLERLAAAHQHVRSEVDRAAAALRAAMARTD